MTVGRSGWATAGAALRLALGNLPVPPNPLHWSASRTNASRWTIKKSPSRFRFRPPLPLTFRFRLATAPYCLRTRFRPTCAPCSAQSGNYGTQEGGSRGLKTPGPQFAVFPFFNISTAFFASVDNAVESPYRMDSVQSLPSSSASDRLVSDQADLTGLISLV